MRLKTIGIIGLVFTLAVAIIPAWGADFSTCTNEELASMRGTMRDASAEDRAAFRKEWQNRLQSMTVEERQKNIGRPANAPEKGYGMNQQTDRAGGGSYGKHYRKRKGGGSGRN